MSKKLLNDVLDTTYGMSLQFGVHENRLQFQVHGNI